MSYTPNTWQDGDTITAAKLNNMENGIVIADPFVITLTPTAADLSGTMDKTPLEITLAVEAGQRIMFSIPALGGLVECTQYMNRSQSGITYSAFANIVFNPGSGTALLQIGTSSIDQTYTVEMFPLT